MLLLQIRCGSSGGQSVAVVSDSVVAVVCSRVVVSIVCPCDDVFAIVMISCTIGLRIHMMV